MKQKTLRGSARFPHQVGHDVMVALDVLPDADNLRGVGAHLSVNLTGLQHKHALITLNGACDR